MPFADSDGIRIHYEDTGEGEPVLLCLPGCACLVGVTSRRFSRPWPSA
jgi:hypothetical protein